MAPCNLRSNIFFVQESNNIKKVDCTKYLFWCYTKVNILGSHKIVFTTGCQIF